MFRFLRRRPASSDAASSRAERRISSASDPGLAGLGTEYGIEWQASIDPNLRTNEPADIFARFTADADPIPADILVKGQAGLRYVSAGTVIAAHREEIARIHSVFTATHTCPDFDDLFARLIWNFACMVGILPASRGHHHAKRGGLFTHSLDVAYRALQLSSSYNLCMDSIPRNRDADALAWQLAAFIGGLLHDIGKVHTIGIVHAYSQLPDPDQPADRFISSAAPRHRAVWHPTICTLEQWAKSNRVESYYIDYSAAVARPHAMYLERYFVLLVPQALRAFLLTSEPGIVSMLEDFLPNPEKGLSLPLFRVVKDADMMSVAEDLDPQAIPGNGLLSALIVRRFIEHAGKSSWNHVTAPFIRAHVQLTTDDQQSYTYVQLPFFVAQPQHIASFVTYILSQPMFGHHLARDRAEEEVFNALEAAGLLVRTIPLILGSQIPLEDYPSYIPASIGRAVFEPPARSPSSSAESGAFGMVTRFVEMELPLVPIGGALRITQRDRMPTVSFDAAPKVAPTESLAVRIDDGELKPEDSQLDRDPEARERLRKIKDVVASVAAEDRQAISKIAEKSLSSRMKAGKAKPSRATAGTGTPPASAEKAPADLADTPPTASPSVSPFDDAPTESMTSGASAPGSGDLFSSAAGDLWIQAYLQADLQYHDGGSEPAISERTFWASVYLFLQGHASELVPEGESGEVVVHRDAFDKRSRSLFLRSLNERDYPTEPLYKFWPISGLKRTDYGVHFADAPDDTRIRLSSDLAALIEGFKGHVHQ